MAAILTLIFVIAISMLVTKVATIALTHTGMPRDRARFQARSAFSGAGFTTSESETVVKHPLRRRIIMLLILLGNAGVVTAISTLILGFTGPTTEALQQRNLILLFAGILLLYLAARSRRLDQFLDRIINCLLERYGDFKPQSFSRLMTVMEDFEVSELVVGDNTWLEGNTLAGLKLPEEGVLVLGILRDEDKYIGVPRGRYEIEEGDRLIVYGRAERIADIRDRHDSLTGKEEHEESVEEHKGELEEQDQSLKD